MNYSEKEIICFSKDMKLFHDRLLNEPYKVIEYDSYISILFYDCIVYDVDLLFEPNYISITYVQEDGSISVGTGIVIEKDLLEQLQSESSHCDNLMNYYNLNDDFIKLSIEYRKRKIKSLYYDIY